MDARVSIVDGEDVRIKVDSCSIVFLSVRKHSPGFYRKANECGLRNDGEAKPSKLSVLPALA